MSTDNSHVIDRERVRVEHPNVVPRPLRHEPMRDWNDVVVRVVNTASIRIDGTATRNRHIWSCLRIGKHDAGTEEGFEALTCHTAVRTAEVTGGARGREPVAVAHHEHGVGTRRCSWLTSAPLHRAVWRDDRADVVLASGRLVLSIHVAKRIDNARAIRILRALIYRLRAGSCGRNEDQPAHS